RMVDHRRNPPCAGCHVMMDPLGLALENFDAVGKWRALDESGGPIDASGAMPDGTKFDRARGRRQALLGSDRFVMTLTEKLMTYALGRGVDYYDEPAVRAIVRTASRDDFPFVSPTRRSRPGPPPVVRRLPLRVAHSRRRSERCVSDEESAMRIITKRALPRRTFLRGAGVALGLPLLDAMVPALSALADTPAAVASRLGFIYMPNGVAKNSSGIDYWTPPTEGRNFQMSQILMPLERFRDRLLVVSGLDQNQAEAGNDGASGD